VKTKPEILEPIKTVMVCRSDHIAIKIVSTAWLHQFRQYLQLCERDHLNSSENHDLLGLTNVHIRFPSIHWLATHLNRDGNQRGKPCNFPRNLSQHLRAPPMPQGIEGGWPLLAQLHLVDLDHVRQELRLTRLARHYQPLEEPRLGVRSLKHSQ
jgi:hypothetical protein